MCLSGAMYHEFEDEEDEFYNKNSDDWDYYSGLPSPRAYQSE